MRHRDRRTLDAGDPRTHARLDHRVIFTTDRRPVPRVGFARLEPVGIDARQLRPQLALPVAEVTLDEALVAAEWLRRKADPTAHDLHRLRRSRQRACDEIDGMRTVADKIAQHETIAFGLRPAPIVDRDVGLPLVALLAVPIRLPVTDEVERDSLRQHRQTLSTSFPKLPPV